MKLRYGFVSNSSSSSYIIDHYFYLPPLPATDRDLAQIFFGSQTPTCKYNEKDYPLDVPSAIAEVKDLLAKGLHPVPIEGYTALAAKRIVQQTNELKSLSDFITYMKEHKIEKKDKWTQSMIQKYTDRDRLFPYAGKSHADALAMLQARLPPEATYLIFDTNEIAEGDYGSQGRANRLKEGKIDGKNAEIECLFQGIDENDHTQASWCVDGDQCHVEEYWLDVVERKQANQRMKTDPEYSTFLRLKQKFTAMKDQTPASKRILQHKLYFHEENNRGFADQDDDDSDQDHTIIDDQDIANLFD